MLIWMLTDQRNGQLRKQYRNTNKQKRNTRRETVNFSSFNYQIRVKMRKFLFIIMRNTVSLLTRQFNEQNLQLVI